MEKLCTRCETTKPIDCFSWKNKAVGRRSAECKECHRAIRNAYYAANAEKERAAIRLRKSQIGDWLREQKLGLSCSRCPESHPATLDFHHRDQGDKLIEISRIVKLKGWCPDRILEEMRKCEVLCSNCHRKSHWDPITGRFDFYAEPS